MKSRGHTQFTRNPMTTFEIAQLLGQTTGHGITCTERGYFYKDGHRISKEQAQAALQVRPLAGTWHFTRLNAATQAFFFQLCEQIQSATQDHGMLIGAKIGKDIPSIGLANAPRLTNLKKAGMIKADCAKGWVILTDLGRETFLATI